MPMPFTCSYRSNQNCITLHAYRIFPPKKCHLILLCVWWNVTVRRAGCTWPKTLLLNCTDVRIRVFHPYIGFSTLFYVVRHLDFFASCLPIGLHLGFFRSWPSLYLPSSFSSVFLLLILIIHMSKCFISLWF